MRQRDENKREAIFEATVGLLNEVGYDGVSMSKIAAAAGVSPSTIYVYFDNKDDMLKKVYLDVKKKLFCAMTRGLTADMPVRSAVSLICHNLLDFMRGNEGYLLFLEQSAGSPRIDALWQDEVKSLFEPIFALFERGAAEGVLKKAPPLLLCSFCFHPVAQIYKQQCRSRFAVSGLDYELVFRMCWDAVRA
ncbi:MAG: TetR/AcrR family transcriptional regulator [Synergistaceae bacterium]|nr:TetR/AcrR family transcriptional regulator [Synergistaceae bacterium]